MLRSVVRSSEKAARADRLRPGRPEKLGRSICHILGLSWCHTLLGQFFFCALVLGEMRQTHAMQHIWGLGELDVVVADDLDAVAPGIPKVQKGTINSGDTSCLECHAGRLLVVDDKAEMATIVRRLLAALLKG